MNKMPCFEIEIPSNFPELISLLKSSNSGNELLGICEGIVSDKIVTPKEVDFLNKWLSKNKLTKTNKYLDAFMNRLIEFVESGHTARHNRERIFEILNFISRGENQSAFEIIDFNEDYYCKTNDILYAKNIFCTTGTFIYGTKNKCHDYLASKGAFIHDVIHDDTDYLLVGTLRTKTANQITNKLAEAKAKGTICIVPECIWLDKIYGT